jgi:replicative DNA helicase
MSKVNTQPKFQPTLALPEGKVLPNLQEVEAAVLGACLLEPDTLDQVLEIISDRDVFYTASHNTVMRTLRAMYECGKKIDLLTVTDELRKSGELDSVGGPFGITKITMSVVSAAHAITHTRLIMEAYMLRRLIGMGYVLINRAFDPGADCFEVLETAEQTVYDIAEVTQGSDVVHIRSVMAELMANIETRQSLKSELSGLPTGFRTLDLITGGWQKQDLIIVAARPSVGKTAFTINTAIASLFENHPVAMFNLEMGSLSLGERMLSRISGVYMDKIRNSFRFIEADHEAAARGANQIASLPLMVDDTAGLSLLEFSSKARRLKRKHKIDLIIVDYLQLMETSVQGGNREQEIAKISRGLKKMAKELDLPIIALSQLNRAIDTAKRKPQLSDLRESGAIEQDADMVIFLSKAHPEEIAQDASMENKVLVEVSKHRNGGLGRFMIETDNSTQSWKEFTPETGEMKSALQHAADNNRKSKPLQPEELPF